MGLKRQMLAIQDVYVPVKRRQTLDPQKVETLVESMLAKGQETPILVRPDGTCFVLVEGLHRLEACKAPGETTAPPIWFWLANIDLRLVSCWAGSKQSTISR
jgi:uncharacterized ParB-like nuclease family protein